MRIAFISLLALGASAIMSFVVMPPSNPLKGVSLYTNPASQVASWVRENPTDGRLPEINKIAAIPQATWLSGSTTADQASLQKVITESATEGNVPVIVLYNIPKRDCGSYSAGGAINAQNYKQWISMISNTIGNNKVIAIIEPDALADMECLSAQEKEERFTLIFHGTAMLSQNKNAHVYIDAGHSKWHSAEKIAERLEKAGIKHAQGFSLNISNFLTTDETVAYGRKVAKLFLQKKTFVIDTSRNGNGPTDSFEWCNPKGRALGVKPTTNPEMSYVDAYLWIKPPGESDGTCNGGPSAGKFWPQYAYELALNTKE